MDRESIGPYRILERLGAGGMGEVFLALDTRLGRKVALKSLSDPAIETPQARARLLREARAAAHITHPNIAAIYDILDVGEYPCIVMEYAQGEPLSAVVARGPLPCADVLAIARQIVDAVGHAHAAGVIHRDLKPANIVLTQGRVVKVLDFGLARSHEAEEQASADSDTEVTRTETQSRVGALAGTPAYMAPEQLVGKPATPLSDIYSIGSTLFELLAGRRPFEGPTPVAIAWDIVSKPTPIVSDAVASVPAALAAVVAKAMARFPADRYQSASEMAEALRIAEVACRPGSQPEVESVAAPSSGTGISLPSSTIAPRVAIVAVVLAAIALCASVFVAIRLADKSAPVASSQFVAVVPFLSPDGDQAAADDAAGFTEADRFDARGAVVADDAVAARRPMAAGVGRWPQRPAGEWRHRARDRACHWSPGCARIHRPGRGRVRQSALDPALPRWDGPGGGESGRRHSRHRQGPERQADERRPVAVAEGARVPGRDLQGDRARAGRCSTAKMSAETRRWPRRHSAGRPTGTPRARWPLPGSRVPAWRGSTATATWPCPVPRATPSPRRSNSIRTARQSGCRSPGCSRAPVATNSPRPPFARSFGAAPETTRRIACWPGSSTSRSGMRKPPPPWRRPRLCARPM